jgi:hypothetical protein
VHLFWKESGLVWLTEGPFVVAFFWLFGFGKSQKKHLNRCFFQLLDFGSQKQRSNKPKSKKKPQQKGPEP